LTKYRIGDIIYDTLWDTHYLVVDIKNIEARDPRDVAYVLLDLTGGSYIYPNASIMDETFSIKVVA